ncbi:MAG: hypothetical protein GY858_07855 [Candidatus Omnitrophica bacterium]|nr:hypothetical protein [Candidatus Omnitrophota bacterium]
MKILKIVFPIAKDLQFDYLIPPGFNVKRGMRVLVDFNRRKRVGVVVNLADNAGKFRLKPILKILDNVPILDDDHLNFAMVLKKHYPYSLGELLFMFLPTYLKKPHNLDLDLSSKLEKKSGGCQIFVKQDNFAERYNAWKSIVSDKLCEGSVLICFPQVTYLKQAQALIERDFPGRVKTIYSRQSEKQMFSSWKDSRKNTIILGTRVSVFYYPSDLSLLVVEDENNSSYSQEEKPFYNLLDVAFLLSKIKKIDLILSADFPSLLTYKKIKDGKVKLKGISESASNIEVVGVGQYKKTKLISPLLIALLTKAITAKKRVVIFWQRSGLGRVILCSSCGHIFKCDRCSTFLRLLAGQELGICSFCGRKHSLPKICNQCNRGYVKSSGLGIQRLEGMLRRTFTDVNIASWDQRTENTQFVLSTSKILSTLYKKEKFDLGFVLDGDSFLSQLNYDATFNAGVYFKKLSLFFNDKIYIFTRNKEHYLFDTISNDWSEFYDKELLLREELSLPPFGLVVKIVLRFKNEMLLLKRAQQLYNKLEKNGLNVYGPLKEYPFKLRDYYRYALVVRSKKDSGLRDVIEQQLQTIKASGMKIAVIIR